MQDENTLREVAKDCVHCGFCLPACPTYQLWGEEMDSPRGRIHLVSQILDGAELSPGGGRALRPLPGLHGVHDRLPVRRSVRPAHRSGRAWTEEARPTPWRCCACWPGTSQAGPSARTSRGTARGHLRAVPLSPPASAHARAAASRAAHRAGPAGGSAAACRGALSPALGAALRLAPSAKATPRLPERVAARGPQRAVVGMLTGCVQSVFFPEVNAATARVLPAMEGCDVVIPRNQGCCGALSLHWAGRPKRRGSPGTRSRRSSGPGWTPSWSTRPAAARP